MTRVLPLFILFLIMSAALQASGLPANACVPGTLATYEGMSIPCNIGQLFYDNFAFPNPPSTGVPASQIWLTPVGQGFSFRDTPDGGGVTFTPFSSSSPITYTIDYRFTIDPAADASASLGMDPPFGNVVITNVYCNDSTPNSDGTCINANGGVVQQDRLNVHTDPTNPLNICIDPSTGANTCFDQIVFPNPALSFGNVRTTIQINGSAGTPAGFDSTTEGSVVINDAPEPGAAALILSGLLLIPIRRRFHSMRPARRV